QYTRPMWLKRPKSLSSLLLLHEFAFFFLVIIAGGIGGLSAYFWHQNSTESIRLNELLSVTEQIRSALFRQIQAAIRVRVLEDSQSLDVYAEYSRLIDKQFNRLRQVSETRPESEAIQGLQQSYREIQRDMNKIFTDPYTSDIRVRMKILDPRFAEAMVGSFEQRYEKFRERIETKHLVLDENLKKWTQQAPYILTLTIVMAVVLIWFARNILNEGFLKPMQGITHGARIISGGRLDHQIPEHGVEEISELARAINRMAADLEKSRDALVQSEKQAALGALVPVVAHNIRNPLASIRATAQVLDDIEDRNELHECRQAILDTIDRLGRWVTALVSYLHPLQPNKRRVSVTALLESPLSILKSRLDEKQIEVKKVGWNDKVMVDVDPDLMEQALYGLMANAVDASPRGASLAIEFHTDLDHVIIHLQDEGGGLPFQPDSSNLEPGPSTKRFGTGLGIPIAFKICQTHGWGLTFNIDEGRGTEVIITAPLPS
ncbi:MAG: HAMP domain-containing sensor histidine kinase, partial [Gammaproteobacteria bacterium]|nr:HAMP domain-containing sensor histidine kinase [Gammaproteobacteria bacterium]